MAVKSTVERRLGELEAEVRGVRVKAIQHDHSLSDLRTHTEFNLQQRHDLLELVRDQVKPLSKIARVQEAMKSQVEEQIAAIELKLSTNLDALNEKIEKLKDSIKDAIQNIRHQNAGLEQELSRTQAYNRVLSQNNSNVLSLRSSVCSKDKSRVIFSHLHSQ